MEKKNDENNPSSEPLNVSSQHREDHNNHEKRPVLYCIDAPPFRKTETHTETGRKKERKTDIQTRRQTTRQTGRQTDKDTLDPN